MKLTEITIPMDVATGDGPFDSMTSRDQEDSMSAPRDTRHNDRERIRKTPKHNSNVSKGQRIKNLVQLKKRASNPEQDETPFKSHLAGHGSAFLNR